MLFVLWLAIGLCQAPGTPKEDEDFSAGQRGEKIARWVESFEPHGFTGSVLAAKDGQVVVAVATGFADLDGKVPNTPATLYEVASVTKSLTAIAALKLAQQGKLSLDSSIAEYLPAVPENCKPITLRQLLQHTSGISGDQVSGGQGDPEKSIAAYLSTGPINPPGSKFEYWNQGYALASEVLARAGGQPYTELCRELVFAPAGMSASCFTGDRPPQGAIVAVGRSLLEEPRSALEHPYGAYDLRYRGMGGAVSNVWDWWRLNLALENATLLTAESRETLFKPVLGDYALGWYVLKDRQGRRLEMHTGLVRGFSALVMRYPETKSFIVIFCNADSADVYSMAADVDALLHDKQPSRATPPAGIDEKLAKTLAGEYQTSDGRICIIKTMGPVTHIEILWAPPNGPATQATLGMSSAGKLVIHEPREDTEIVATQSDKSQRIESIQLGNITFKRKE